MASRRYRGWGAILFAAAVMQLDGGQRQLALAGDLRPQHPEMIKVPRIELHALSSESVASSGQCIAVTYEGVRDPQSTDVIAAYSPASADSETSAPIKFKYANASSDGAERFLKDGSGTLSFCLLNLRGDYCLRYIRGGFKEPVVLASSPAITLDEDIGPLATHLALASSDGRDIRVSWVSKDGTAPEVRYRPVVDSGSGGGEMAYVAVRGVTSTFTRSQLCGPPANELGFHDPGRIHTAIIDRLEPGTTCEYIVGDSDADQWTRPATFHTPPASGSNIRVRIAIFGDLGTAEADGSLNPGDSNEYCALQTVEVLRGMLRNETLDLVLHLGDISYASGYLAIWDTFFDMIGPVARHVPWMATEVAYVASYFPTKSSAFALLNPATAICYTPRNDPEGAPAWEPQTVMGDHERDAATAWPGRPLGVFNNGDSGGECGVPYHHYLPMPPPADVPSHDSPWYSFDYGPLHFTVISSEHEFRQGSEQHEWILHDLAKVDRKTRPWLIFASHRPLYVDSIGDDGWDSHQNGARLLRGAFEDVLRRYQVDIAFAGHCHAYQRTCQVTNGSCVARAGEAYKAPMYVLAGAAGKRLANAKMEPTPPPQFEFIDAHRHGVAHLEADMHTLTLSFVTYTGESIHVVDTITLEKRVEGDAERSEIASAMVDRSGIPSVTDPTPLHTGEGTDTSLPHRGDGAPAKGLSDGTGGDAGHRSTHDPRWYVMGVVLISLVVITIVRMRARGCCLLPSLCKRRAYVRV